MRSNFKREILYYENYYEDFFSGLPQKTQLKFLWTLGVIATLEWVPEKYLRSIQGSQGLYEIRVEESSNIYRVFCFFDEGDLVILINGFQKKTDKTPRREILRAQRLQKSTTMKKKKPALKSFSDHLDELYGTPGTKARDEYEQGFEAFKLGVMLQELRKGKGLTQQQLADRCGTTKNYISRIENDASDIRLSTLMRIVADGLGATLRLSVG